MEQIEQKLDFNNLSGGLELLVELAEKNEIDPWDIDIIEITDKYLAALNQTPRENLLNAGRAIFFASVLLRLKSDILLNISNETLISSRETENLFPEDELLLEDGRVHLDLARLESYLIRSSLSKQQRKRKISLGDLITALQQAEEEEDRRALRAKLRADRVFTIAAIDGPEDMFEIAQDDDVEEVVEKVEAIIQEHLTTEKPITLSFLSEILNNKTKPFLALLFLAHVQKVVLEQKEMYGEIFVYRSGTILQEVKTEITEIQKIKRHKKTKQKTIEVTTKGNEVIDITVKNNKESGVITDGNTA